MSLNQKIFELIWNMSGRGPFLDGVEIFFAKYLPYLLMLGFLVLVLKQKGWRRKTFFFGEAAIAVILARGLIDEIIRFFYYHPRPFDALGFAPLISESGSSFPSGHASWFFALALTIFFYDRTWGIWYLVFAALNGFARIYVGVHWPFDILGGVGVGLFSAWIVHLSLRKESRQVFTEPQAPAS